MYTFTYLFISIYLYIYNISVCGESLYRDGGGGFLCLRRRVGRSFHACVSRSRREAELDRVGGELASSAGFFEGALDLGGGHVDQLHAQLAHRAADGAHHVLCPHA